MPASRPSADYPGQKPARQPEVPRPRGAIIDAIEQEGVSWEGQALVVGHDDDIATRLIVTTERLLLVHQDEILLETPRTWLVPAPLVVADNDIRVSITPEGVVPGRDNTERLQLRIRDGRGPAQQLVAILTGRSRTGAAAGTTFEAEFPNWSAGAGRSNALPQLPAFETRQDDSPNRRRATDDPETRGVAPIADWRPQAPERGSPPPTWRAPEPEPVEATSRAARFLTYQPASAMTDMNHDPADVSATPVTSIEDERERRSAGRSAGWLVWTSRVAMVALVILVAGWFGREYLPEPVTEQLPAFVTNDLASNNEQSEPDIADTTAENGDGTDGAENNPADVMPTEAALGVGGAVTAIPDADVEGEGEGEGGTLETAGEIPTPTPPVDDSGAADLENTVGEGEAAQDDNGVIPVPEETEIENPEPTTPAQDLEPVESTVPDQGLAPVEPTAPDQGLDPVAETPAPTAESTIPGRVDLPGTPEPPVTVEEAQAPTPAPPTLEPQRASVNPENPPAQVFADQGFRYSVEGASTGSSLPELPDVAEITYGEWLVLSVNGQNWTDSQQVFDMNRFTLIADGEPIQLDVGNSWVASLLDYMPAYGNTDAILWAPGEQHQFVLTFLAPPDAQSLVLQAGDQRFDLSTVLSGTGTLMNLNQSVAPETIDAVVVDVNNGESIVIEKDGIEQTVRYLGIDVPDEEDCFFAESTEANRVLVEGRNVKVERQATNVDAQGNWVRDVWVETNEGRYILVAHQLVQQGSAVADISEPNTRFTGWLRGAEAVAQAEGRGLWGVCSAEQLSEFAPDSLTDNTARRMESSA